MDTETVFPQTAERPTPIGISLGEQPAPTTAAAIDAVDGLTWLPEITGEVVIASAEGKTRDPAQTAARTLAEIVDKRGGRARVLTPGRLPFGALPPFGDRRRWVESDISGSGARIGRLSVCRQVVEAPALIGVGAIGGPDDADPLAIGLWRRYVHPRLAIAARLGGHRAPLAAELALPIRPRLLLLVGRWGSLKVAIATPDQIAAELAGLAIRYGAIEDPADRPRVWEDPLIQRATELGLGVLHPSALELRPVWAGSSGSPAATALTSLAGLLADALGIQ